jgi:hypothetical protein
MFCFAVARPQTDSTSKGVFCHYIAKAITPGIAGGFEYKKKGAAAFGLRLKTILLLFYFWQL